jgi:hypothetical protein
MVLIARLPNHSFNGLLTTVCFVSKRPFVTAADTRPMATLNHDA